MPLKETLGCYILPSVLFMPFQLDAAYHSYPQFLHLNCLPGFLLAQPQNARMEVLYEQCSCFISETSKGKI